MKNAPMILKINNRRYILEKIYSNYALYTNLDNGIRECFHFHDLEMLEEMVEPPKKYWNPEKVIV